jgi:ectoine hydroxylase-related dioxygenase (phytanoyl-CoA dioxygenase family)
LGGDVDGTYFDVPRMRVTTSGDYLNAGVAYALHPHRDIWYGSPACQFNWWLPVFPFESESSFAFYPQYWSEPVSNTSGEYNHYEWNRVARGAAAKERSGAIRPQPHVTGHVDLQHDFRVVCPPGGVILFSGAHLHGTVPNTSGRSRFSIDFRTAHIDELANVGGAPAPDRACSGTTLFELRRVRDLEPVPMEIIRRHDPSPPEDLAGVVFRPDKVNS